MTLRTLCFAMLIAAPLPVLAQGIEAERFDCMMDPSELVLVGSPQAGLLGEVIVRRGQVVRAGDPIARLVSDLEEATVALLEADAASTAELDAQRAQRDLAATRYERTEELVERNVGTADQLDVARAELVTAESLVAEAELNRDLAQRELERARSALAQRTIRSPIDGIVFSRNRSAGEFLSQDDHIVAVVALDPLYVEAYLPVEYYPSVRAGMAATVEPGLPIGGAYEARVTVVDQVFDAASGTFGVRLEMPNPDASLPGGQRCTVSFPGDG